MTDAIYRTERGKRCNDIAKDLYNTMPGAPPVPRDRDGVYWGEVEDTEHWRFCYRIACAIVFVALGEKP